jgi:uncharacterized membrane protein YidH (DUF202 family)
MPALTSTIFAALSLLAFAFGVAEVALESAVLRNFDKYAARTSTSWPEHHREGLFQSLLLIPANLTTGVTDAIIVSGSMALVYGIISFLHAVTIARCNVEQVKPYQVSQPASYLSSRSNVDQEKSTVATFIIGVASTAATFAILIYAFVKEYTSSEFHYTDFESSGSHFTRESWACQMEVQYRSKTFWVWTCSDAV